MRDLLAPARCTGNVSQVEELIAWQRPWGNMAETPGTSIILARSPSCQLSPDLCFGSDLGRGLQGWLCAGREGGRCARLGQGCCWAFKPGLALVPKGRAALPLLPTSRWGWRSHSRKGHHGGWTSPENLACNLQQSEWSGSIPRVCGFGFLPVCPLLTFLRPF